MLIFSTNKNIGLELLKCHASYNKFGQNTWHISIHSFNDTKSTQTKPVAVAEWIVCLLTVWAVGLPFKSGHPTSATCM